MKRRNLLLILSFLSITGTYAQISNYNVIIDSIRFSEQVTFEIDVNFGDSLNFEFFDLKGFRIAHLLKEPIYKSEHFTMKIESINNGVYVTSLKVNSERMNNRLLHDGDAKNTTINLKVEVLELGFDRLTVYPNPATSSDLNVIIESSEQSIRLKIYNLEGKKLLAKRLINSTGIINEEIDISTLGQGQYLIMIVSKNGKTTQRFIKNR